MEISEGPKPSEGRVRASSHSPSREERSRRDRSRSERRRPSRRSGWGDGGSARRRVSRSPPPRDSWSKGKGSDRRSTRRDEIRRSEFGRRTSHGRDEDRAPPRFSRESRRSKFGPGRSRSRSPRSVEKSTALKSPASAPKPLPSTRRTWRFDSPPKDPSAAGAGDTPTSGWSNFSSGPDGHRPVVLRPPGTSSFSDGPEGGVGGGEFSSMSHLAQIAQTIGLSAEGTKAARELYVGNLPPGVDVNQLVEFLNAAMTALKLSVMPGSPVVKSWISTDGHFAFAEFRTMEEASNGMQLNGLNCLGYNLRIGRPKTYPSELAAFANQTASASSGLSSLSNAMDSSSASGSVLTGGGGQTSERLVMLHVPVTLTESRAKELLTTFGALRFFQYLKTTKSSSSHHPDYTREVKEEKEEAKSLLKEENMSSPASPQLDDVQDPSRDDIIIIFEFDDSSGFDLARTHLDNLRVANKDLRVMGAQQAVADGLLDDLLQADPDVAVAIGGEMMRVEVPTRCVMLANLVTPEELADDSEFSEIVDDVRLECQSFGQVTGVEIPRPPRGFSPSEVDQSDVGFAFVQFTTVEGAGKARKTLSGRKFSGRTVEAHYFSEIRFQQRSFKTPEPNYQKQHSSLYNDMLSSVAKAELAELAELAKIDGTNPPPPPPSSMKMTEVSEMKYDDGEVMEEEEE